MESMLVRLRPFEARRGNVLRRYTYRGIKFHEERGWYRVDKAVAEYLRKMRQEATDLHSPLAFDICTEDEAKASDAKEKEAATKKKAAEDDIKLSKARESGAVTSGDLLLGGSSSATGPKGQIKKTRGK